MNETGSKIDEKAVPSTPSHASFRSGTPVLHPHRAPLLPSEILNFANNDDQSTVNFLTSYNSLRVNNNKHVMDSTNNREHVLPNSASCQRRFRGDNRKDNQSRSESMMNFSKRFSILTGRELVFPGNQEDDFNDNCPPPIPRHGGHETPPPVPLHNHPLRNTNSFIRIREKPAPRPHASTPMHQSYSHSRMMPPPLPPHQNNNLLNHHHLQRPNSRLSSPDVLMFMSKPPMSPHVRMRESVPPPLPPHHPRLGSLVSLDRRMMPSGSGFHPALTPIHDNDSVRRSALLRSASSTAAAVAAAASAGQQHSTLGPNQFLHSSPSQLINQPVPRSLQVSPALTQRSLYAQHIFNGNQGSSQIYCTASRMTSSNGIQASPGDHTPRRSSALGWIREELLRHHTSRAAAASPLKTATSEFSFVRPDSPLTLPYNKSKSFYGRPVSVSGHQANNNPTGNGTASVGFVGSNPSLNCGVDSSIPPPPRPPLPRQVSLDSAPSESSTLFRCSAAASAAKRSSRETCTAVSTCSDVPSSSTASSSSSGFSSISNTAHSSSSSSLQRVPQQQRHHKNHHRYQHKVLSHQPSLPESLSSDSESQYSIASMPVTSDNTNGHRHQTRSSFNSHLSHHNHHHDSKNGEDLERNRPSSYHLPSSSSQEKPSAQTDEQRACSSFTTSTTNSFCTNQTWQFKWVILWVVVHFLTERKKTDWIGIEKRPTIELKEELIEKERQVKWLQ